MSKAIQRRLARDAQKPVGRMRNRLFGRIVEPCKLACFTCDRFLGHNKHACPGVKAKPDKDLPICHVDFRTGKMQSPINPHTGRLFPGQEKFYQIITSGPWPAENGCAWAAVRNKPLALRGDNNVSGGNPPAVPGAY